MSPVLGIIASSNQQGRAGGPISAYDALAAITVPSGGLANIVFSGIPTGYRHLQIRYNSRSNSAGINQTFFSINGDTSANYSSHILWTDGGGGVGTGSYTTDGFCRAGVQGGPTLATNIFGVGIIDLLDYADTNKYKTARTMSGTEANGSGVIWYSSSNWRSFAPINSLTFTSENGSFIQNTQFALYGVK